MHCSALPCPALPCPSLVAVGMARIFAPAPLYIDPAPFALVWRAAQSLLDLSALARLAPLGALAIDALLDDAATFIAPPDTLAMPFLAPRLARNAATNAAQRTVPAAACARASLAHEWVYDDDDDENAVDSKSKSGQSSGQREGIDGARKRVGSVSLSEFRARLRRSALAALVRRPSATDRNGFDFGHNASLVDCPSGDSAESALQCHLRIHVAAAGPTALHMLRDAWADDFRNVSCESPAAVDLTLSSDPSLYDSSALPPRPCAPPSLLARRLLARRRFAHASLTPTLATVVDDNDDRFDDGERRKQSGVENEVASAASCAAQGSNHRASSSVPLGDASSSSSSSSTADGSTTDACQSSDPQSSHRVRIGYMSADFRRHPVGAVVLCFLLFVTFRF
jgi:hypothetical protein